MDSIDLTKEEIKQSGTIKVSAEKLNKSGVLQLNEAQLNIMLCRTPKSAIKERTGKGNAKWKYVSTHYMQKQLDLLTGFCNSFEIVDEKITETQVIVKGRLTCQLGDKTITKMQYGRKDIIFRSGTKDSLDLGNDLKAAASDSFKKCCSMLGIARDIYSAEDFTDIEVIAEVRDWNTLSDLYDAKKENIEPDEQINIERVLKNEESNSYNKLLAKLKSL